MLYRNDDDGIHGNVWHDVALIKQKMTVKSSWIVQKFMVIEEYDILNLDINDINKWHF